MNTILSNQSCVVTLSKVWEDYRRIRRLKTSSIVHYDKVLNRCFEDWLDLDVRQITKASALNRHQDLTIHRGQVTANVAMRLLRALLNFANYKYEVSDDQPFLGFNATKRISELQAWNPEKPKQNYVKPNEIRQWFEGISKEVKSATLRDAYQILMLTGLRKCELIGLKWQHVDISNEILTIEDTKNGTDLILPICPYVRSVFERRKPDATNPSHFVFPGASPFTPFFLNSQHALISYKIGIPFSPHALRRTHLTTGERLGIPHHILSRIANHKLNGITDRYLIIGAERLREPVMQITNELLTLGGITNI